MHIQPAFTFSHFLSSSNQHTKTSSLPTPTPTTTLAIVVKKDGSLDTQTLSAPRDSRPKKPFYHFRTRPKKPKKPTLIPSRLCTLPLEVLTQIVVYVDIDSLLTLSRTCHLWNNLCGPSHHSLWSLLLKRDYSKQMFHTSPYTTYKYNYCLDKKWKKGRPDITRFIGHDDTVYCMAWLGKDYLVSGSRDASIKRWRLSNASLVSTHTEHQGSVMCLRVSKDQSFMVTGSSDSTCIVWSLPSCTPQQRFHQHQAGILDVCISLNYIVSASKEGAVWVWTQHGKALHSLVGHTGSVQSLAAYGDTIVSASEDATLRVWDIATGTCLATLKGHVMGVTCVLIHNNLIYSGGHDGRIKVWNNYECIMTMVGHSQLIRTLAVYEGRVVSGSYDRTLRVWDIKTGQCLLRYQCDDCGWIYSVLMDSSRMVSCGQKQRMFMLDFGRSIAFL